MSDGSTSCGSCGGALDGGVCACCDTAALPAAQNDIDGAPLIRGYRILAQLGEGGMGAVYLAEELALGRKVAIKVVSKRVAADAQAKARFLREARLLATIEHPHVVRVYSFGEVQGQPYLVMEYVEGETLAERLARGGALPIDEAVRITRDIVDALDAAWERKVVHRDIKPSNILIDKRNRVHVADFGLAKPMHFDAGDSLTQSGFMLGTPHYISPEQAQGADADFRSDLYSLGVMLYQMLTGERPFDGPSPIAIIARHLNEPMPSLKAKRRDVPPHVEKLTAALTQKDPRRRPSSHSDVLAVLDGLATRTPSAPMPSFVAMPVMPPRSGMRGTVLLLAAAILLATAYVWLRPRTPARGTATPTGTFVVAVAPFYGPDDDSAKEGRVMAALIEREVAQRLGNGARVVGIEETKSPLRSHDEARALGERLHANAVIWGEAFALRRETEIQPYITVVKGAAAKELPRPNDARLGAAARPEDVERIENSASGVLKLQGEAPNQIELRKTSAAGIGEAVLLLAGMHALEQHQRAAALAIFRQAPRSAERLRYEVQALLQMSKLEEARTTLLEAIALDPNDAPSQALLGDLDLESGRTSEAMEAYRRAAAIGKPFTASRGIFFENKFYTPELFRDPMRAKASRDTLYLLAIDPASQHVVERHLLPGVATAMRTDGDALVVTCEAGTALVPVNVDVRLRGGRIEHDSPWISPSLLLRLNGVKAGRTTAVNFLETLTGTRELGDTPGTFTLAKKPAAGYARTLPELETALRAQAERDPTQPWHLFLLAVTLREEKKIGEANTVMSEMLRRDYPSIPYVDYTWMANLLVRLQAYEWYDGVMARAFAARARIPQTVAITTLIERLINASFARQGAFARDPVRGYRLLVDARRISGLCLEGDEVVSAIWADHFAAAGDPRAATERAVSRETAEHPLDYLVAVVKSDYAIGVTAAVGAGYLALVIYIGATALLRKRRGRFAVSRRERLVASLACALFVLATVFAVDRVLMLQALGDMPVGVSDALGHPQTVARFDALLAARESDALRYMTALAHHYAGDFARAEALYAKVPQLAGANGAAARVGKMPVRALTKDEIGDAIAGQRPARWRRAPDNVLASWLLLAPLAAILLLLPLFLGTGRADGDDLPLSRAGRTAMLLLPGFYDVRRGRAWRALAIVLTISALVPLFVLVRPLSHRPAAGALSRGSLPNLEVAYPLPTTDPNPGQTFRKTLFLATPGMKTYLALLIAASAVGVALHLARVPAILRDDAEHWEEAPTAITPPAGA